MIFEEQEEPAHGTSLLHPSSKAALDPRMGSCTLPLVPDFDAAELKPGPGLGLVRAGTIPAASQSGHCFHFQVGGDRDSSGRLTAQTKLPVRCWSI